MRYWKRDIDAYARKTAGLSVTEHGVYDLLLDHYYATEDALTRDKGELCRIIRAIKPYERAAVDTVLSKHFSLTERGYVNLRAEEELAEYRRTADVARANGAKGGRPPKPTGLSPGSSRVSQNNPNPETINQKPEKPKNIRAKPARFVLPDWINPQTWKDFEEMRSRIRAPLTDRARASIVARLSEIRRTNDPEAVLLRSIERSWRSVFPISTESWRDGENRATGIPSYCVTCGNTKSWHMRAEKHPEREPNFDGHKFATQGAA